MDSKNCGIVLYDHTSIGRYIWPYDTYGRFARAFLLPLLEEGVTQYIKNARTNLMILAIDGLPIPITCSYSNYDDSYVCSSYTHYVSYLLHELNKIEVSSSQRVKNAIALKTFGAFLRLARLNQTIHVNNWLLSTNLYPNLTPSQIQRVAEYVTARFPNHGVVFRSINEKTTASLMEVLPPLGYALVASRPVYIFPGCSLHRIKKSHRRHIKRDHEMLQDTGYELMRPADFREEHVPRMLELYNLLCIERHSPMNPQLTEKFFLNLIRNRPLELYGLKKCGRMDGIMGYFDFAGTMVTPIVGYDTSLPRSAGLYRMISSLALDIALQNGLIDHAGAGVGSFKRRRGYLPVMEYSAVDVRHLSALRRSAWSLIRTVGERVVIPYIQRFKL